MPKFLGLRTCKADGTSHKGFIWPKNGEVEAPDWSPEPVCGQGLHALLWGEGCADLLNWSTDARWQIVAFDEYVDLSGKVKFPRCVVLHTGTRESATQYLYHNGGAGKRIVGLILAGGDWSTVSGGYRSTVSGGDGSELRLSWCDHNNGRRRTAIAYVGEDGIKPNTRYHLDKEHKFAEAAA